MGRPLDPAEWVSISKDRFTVFTRPARQAVIADQIKYKVKTPNVKEPEIVTAIQLRPLLTEIAQAQEPKASRIRLNELVGKLMDRLWNFHTIYANKVTGEVTTG